LPKTLRFNKALWIGNKINGDNWSKKNNKIDPGRTKKILNNGNKKKEN